MRPAFLYRLFPFALCVTLASCGYFIPPVKNTPRYNEVVGEPRHPQLNPNGNGAAAAPTMDVAQANLPPASDTPIATAPQPIPVVNGTQMMARHVPEENASASEAGTYPVLNNVPASPVAEDRETAARLARVRAQLEDERTAAAMQKSQLAHDAAAEPSLVPADGAVPPPDPVAVAPIAPPAAEVAPMPTPMPMPMKPAAAATPVAPAITASAPMPSRMSSDLPPPPMPLPSTPVAHTAPQPLSQAVAYSPRVQMAPAPIARAIPQAPVPMMASAAPAQEPIILHPPQATAAPAPNTVPYSSQNYAAQPQPSEASGGFNPLENTSTASNSTVYGSTGYLPASRYARQRVN